MDVMKHDLSSFGALLQALRKRRHLTQRQLASAVGVHRSAIIRWEQGDFLPQSKAIVLELARQLHLDEQETRQLLEASLTALAPHWHVPFRRNPFFTGREEILETLHTRLSPGQVVVALTHSYALQGLGGIGKTQLALEYAYRHALDYSAVFWIEAETSETAISSLLHLADVLQLPERQQSDQQRVLVAIQRWLSSHNGWFLIWDNLEDLELLSRLLPTTVRQGSILLTTRCQALGTTAVGMDVIPMAPEEGMLFVLRRAKVLSPEATAEQVQQFAVRLPDEYAAARELVTIMGGLPLALDQAGAYIEETGCGFVGYLYRYQQQRWHLLARRGGMASDHPHSVVTTLGLACQHVAQQDPAALELLRFCACLYPDAIPEELLLAGADQAGSVLGPEKAGLTLFDEALATLRRFSLVQRQPETRMLSLHRLVQVILQDEMSEQEHVELQQRVAHLLNTVFPENTYATAVETWGLCERLLPHVMTCFATIPEHHQDLELAAVLLKAANYLNVRDQSRQTEMLYQRALHLFEQQLGPEHLRVGSALCNLARSYRTQGKHEQAEPLLQRALHLLEQALGPEHPELAFPLRELAGVSRTRGHYEQAEQLDLRVLRIVEQALGPEHPELIFPLRELAGVSQLRGHYEQAEQLYLRAIRVVEQAWGPEHSDLAYPLNNLGLLYCKVGKYEQAEQLYQRAIRVVEQAWGPEHSDLAYPLNNLGLLYCKVGKYAQAEPLCRRALRIWERTLGLEHSDVAASLDTLATLYCKMGNYEQAEPLYQRSVSLVEQGLGPTHPLIAFPLNGLAQIRCAMGKYGEAESLYQRVLQIREQSRGPHHPETAQTLHDLALLRRQQGQRDEACSLAERALAIRLMTLGETHPETIASQALVAQFAETPRTIREEGAFPCSAEALPDQASKEPTEEALITSQEPIESSSSEGDPLRAFLLVCCALHPRAWCRASDLWQAYERWVERSQERFPLSRSAFVAQLKMHGCRAARTNAARIWRGITLLNHGA